MIKVRICENTETVIDDEFTESSGMSWDDEYLKGIMSDLFDWLASEYPAIFDVAECDNNFQNWHGGKFDQFWCRRGFVAINSDAPSAIELCSSIDNKFKNLITEYEERFIISNLPLYSHGSSSVWFPPAGS